MKPKRAVPVPRLVQQFINENLDQYGSPAELEAFARAKVKQVGWSPSALAYMLGAPYQVAASVVRWLTALDK